MVRGKTLYTFTALQNRTRVGKGLNSTELPLLMTPIAVKSSLVIQVTGSMLRH